MNTCLGTDYCFTLDGDRLVWQRRKFSDKPLTPLLPDTFAHDSTRFDFSRDADGAIDGFTANTWRVRGGALRPQAIINH